MIHDTLIAIKKEAENPSPESLGRILALVEKLLRHTESPHNYKKEGVSK